MISQDALLALVEQKGPVLPSEIKRETRTDLILSAAMLSNLVGAKKLKISYLKVGSSPLYYAPGQEKELVKYIEKLPEKTRRAVERLRQEIVLRDSELSPLERFSLEEAKDFAEQLAVTIAGQRETFWKWYLASDEEMELKIRSMLTQSMPVHEPKLKVTAPPGTEYHAPEKKPKKKEETTEETAEEIKPEKKQTEKKESTVGRAVKAIQKLITTPSSSINADWQDDTFYLELMQFFEKNSISVKEQECIRKKTEYDFVISIDSPVGILTYYCKAKAKKKLNEGDLSTIFLKAQPKKMPILLLTNGDLTKQAQEMLTGELQGLTVKKI